MQPTRNEIISMLVCLILGIGIGIVSTMWMPKSTDPVEMPPPAVEQVE